MLALGSNLARFGRGPLKAATCRPFSLSFEPLDLTVDPLDETGKSWDFLLSLENIF